MLSTYVSFQAGKYDNLYLKLRTVIMKYVGMLIDKMDRQ